MRTLFGALSGVQYGEVAQPQGSDPTARVSKEEDRERGIAPARQVQTSQEAAFQCTTCGGCEYQCPVGIQHLPMIIGLRRGAVNTGAWEDDYGSKFFNTLERSGNSLGFASSERMKFIEKNALPIYDGTQEYCLWLGCMGSYDPSGREIVLSLAKVLRHLNIIPCCGKSAVTGIRRGDWETIWLLSQLAGGRHREREGERQDETALHLPALRAHHRDGLEGVWPGVRDRASYGVAGALLGRSCRVPMGARRKWFIASSLLPGPLSRNLRRAS